MCAAGVLFVGFLLWFQLDSLAPGVSQAEIAQNKAAGSLSSLQDNPLNLPYKALHYGLAQLDGLVAIPGRAASAFIGFLIGVGFFFVLWSWYTRRVAMLGTLMLVCSAWFLQSARMGTGSIVYASLFLAIASLVWMQQRHSGTPAILVSLLLLVWLVYIPGMIWFVVPAIWWQFGRFSRFVRGQNLPLILIAAVLAIGSISPMLMGFVNSPELIKTYAGLPQSIPSPLEVLKNILNLPAELFFRGPDTPVRWLGRLPLVDWFGTVMFVIGTYAYFFKRRLDRTKFIAYIFIAGTILVGLGGPVDTAILLPFVYLLITGGIALMLQQWFTVFPRNPLARTTGSVLMTLAVLMSAFYGINQYFIAWPNAPETKKSFQSPVDSP